MRKPTLFLSCCGSSRFLTSTTHLTARIITTFLDRQEVWTPTAHAADHALCRISAHPDVEFLVIVNPNSGPGGASLPGGDYVREVPRLNSFPNVRTVGYVAIDYCKKPLAESCQEIDLYAGWYRDHDIDGLYVQGIFVDETHNHVSDARSQYMDRLHQFIKALDGLAGERLVRPPPFSSRSSSFHFCFPCMPERLR